MTMDWIYFTSCVGVAEVIRIIFRNNEIIQIMHACLLSFRLRRKDRLEGEKSMTGQRLNDNGEKYKLKDFLK